MHPILPTALLTASLVGCGFSVPTTPSTPQGDWIFQMPMIHDTVAEYLICRDSLAKGTSCTFGTSQGTYEEAQDKSFLNLPGDSSVSWPRHDGIGPLFVGRKTR